MLMSTRSRILCFALVLAGAFPARSAQPSDVGKQKSATVTAPVPAQITTAKKAFISNVGVEDGVIPAVFSGGPDRPYNQFYTAMKTWGRYQLVGSPADADVVLEIRIRAPLDLVSNYSPTPARGLQYTPAGSRVPQFQLTILDPKTRIVLWNLTEYVEFAALRANHDKNFDEALVALVNDLAGLAGLPPAIPVAAKQSEEWPDLSWR